MYFWKIDEETIRCLINHQEITQMGFEFDLLNKNDEIMEEFLNEIIEESIKYVDWNPENGLQNYAARVLPANQLLVTISTTFPDEMIDKDLEQIERVTETLQQRVSKERLDHIYNLSGEEKQDAFDELIRELHDIYSGRFDERSESNDTKRKKQAQYFYMPDQIVSFDTLEDVSRFCRMIPKKNVLPASLYRVQKQYELLVRMSTCTDETIANTLLALAVECGGSVKKSGLREAYLREHGKIMIRGNAMEELY